MHVRRKLVAGIFHSNPKLPAAPGGTRHACAIKLDDTLTCWGDNVEDSNVPVLVAGDRAAFCSF